MSKWMLSVDKVGKEPPALNHHEGITRPARAKAPSAKPRMHARMSAQTNEIHGWRVTFLGY